MSQPQSCGPAAGGEHRAGGVLTIDLDAVAANYRTLADQGGAGVACAAVVKGDAYGLGVGRVAPVLFAAGGRSFFVAQLEEGIALRALLPEAAIPVWAGVSIPLGRISRISYSTPQTRF